MISFRHYAYCGHLIAIHMPALLFVGCMTHVLPQAVELYAKIIRGLLMHLPVDLPSDIERIDFFPHNHVRHIRDSNPSIPGRSSLY